MATLKTYAIGYVASIVMTLAAFSAMWLHEYLHHRFPSHEFLAVAFVALAILQLVVQLICFLHIGKKSPASNIVMLSFAIFIVFVLVGGSLWIMTNLQHNQPMDTYINGLIAPQNEND